MKQESLVLRKIKELIKMSESEFYAEHESAQSQLLICENYVTNMYVS